MHRNSMLFNSKKQCKKFSPSVDENTHDAFKAQEQVVASLDVFPKSN